MTRRKMEEDRVNQMQQYAVNNLTGPALINQVNAWYRGDRNVIAEVDENQYRSPEECLRMERESKDLYPNEQP